VFHYYYHHRAVTERKLNFRNFLLSRQVYARISDLLLLKCSWWRLLLCCAWGTTVCECVGYSL